MLKLTLSPHVALGLKPILSFLAPGRTRPWSRARSGRGRWWTRKEDADYRQQIATRFRLAANEAGLRQIEGVVGLVVIVHEPAPKGWKGQPVLKNTRPDADNLGKQIMEALEDSGLVANDSRVGVLLAAKVWSETWVGVEVQVHEAFAAHVSTPGLRP